jgi:predicted Zn-dependent protease
MRGFHQMTQEDEIEKLQIEMYRDPKSGHFVRLAELYLGREMVTEAALLIKDSLKFHPHSVSGLVILGRSLKKLKKTQEAIQPLLDATQLASDNWRA